MSNSWLCPSWANSVSSAYQVEWQAVIGEYYDEEDEIDEKVQHVCNKLQVKNIDTLQQQQQDLRCTIWQDRASQSAE